MEKLKTFRKWVSENILFLSNIKRNAIIRPWLSDFMNPSKFSKPYKKEALKKVKENIKYFLLNYILTGVFLLCFTL